MNRGRNQGPRTAQYKSRGLDYFMQAPILKNKVREASLTLANSVDNDPLGIAKEDFNTINSRMDYTEGVKDRYIDLLLDGESLTQQDIKQLGGAFNTSKETQKMITQSKLNNQRREKIKDYTLKRGLETGNVSYWNKVFNKAEESFTGSWGEDGSPNEYRLQETPGHIDILGNMRKDLSVAIGNMTPTDRAKLGDIKIDTIKSDDGSYRFVTSIPDDKFNNYAAINSVLKDYESRLKEGSGTNERNFVDFMLEGEPDDSFLQGLTNSLKTTASTYLREDSRRSNMQLSSVQRPEVNNTNEGISEEPLLGEVTMMPYSANKVKSMDIVQKPKSLKEYGLKQGVFQSDVDYAESEDRDKYKRDAGLFMNQSFGVHDGSPEALMDMISSKGSLNTTNSPAYMSKFISNVHMRPNTSSTADYNSIVHYLNKLKDNGATSVLVQGQDDPDKDIKEELMDRISKATSPYVEAATHSLNTVPININSYTGKENPSMKEFFNKLKPHIDSKNYMVMSIDENSNTSKRVGASFKEGEKSAFSGAKGAAVIEEIASGKTSVKVGSETYNVIGNPSLLDVSTNITTLLPESDFSGDNAIQSASDINRDFQNAAIVRLREESTGKVFDVYMSQNDPSLKSRESKLNFASTNGQGNVNIGDIYANLNSPGDEMAFYVGINLPTEKGNTYIGPKNANDRTKIVVKKTTSQSSDILFYNGDKLVSSTTAETPEKLRDLLTYYGEYNQKYSMEELNRMKIAALEQK